MVFSPFSFAARPLATEDDEEVGRGLFEIEYGVEYIHGPDKEMTLDLTITRGIFSNLELGIEVPYMFIDAKEVSDSNGLSDVSVFTKFDFLRDNAFFPDCSLEFTYQSDSGDDDKGLGEGKPEYSLNSIFSKDFELWELFLNMGYTFREDFPDENNPDLITYGLAFEYPINDIYALVGEIDCEAALQGKFRDNAGSVLIGISYSFEDDVIFDFGVGVEISETDADLKITSGITFVL
jgi:hypothetical protein